VGVGVNLSGITLWRPVLDSFDLLGRAALGTSLLTIGAGLSLAAALNPSVNVVVAVVGKLIISPMVMLFIAHWFGVTGLPLSILVLCAAVPTSMNGYLVTKKMGGDAELYASAATLQTVGSFVTIPLFLALASQFGGVF
jgi:malonate transporter